MRPGNGRKAGTIFYYLLEGGGVFELQFGGRVVEIYILLAVDLVEFGVFPHPFILYVPYHHYPHHPSGVTSLKSQLIPISIPKEGGSLSSLSMAM